MEVVITQSEVIRYIELIKQRHECEFRIAYLIEDKKTDDKAAADLKSISQQTEKLMEKFGQANFKAALVSGAKIIELKDKLKKCKKEDTKNALKNKNDAIYELMVAFNKLLKQNFEKREDIAKLNIFVNNLTNNERELVLNIIETCIVTARLSLNCSKPMKANIVKFMNRIGINVSLEGEVIGIAERHIPYEVCVTTPSKRVWVSLENAEKVKTNLQTIQLLSARLQVINAERQLKQFPAEREQEFVSLQEKYLILLKERDELLKDFTKENEIAYKPLAT